MTRKLTRKSHLRSVVIIFIAILTLLIVASALAQLKDEGQTSGTQPYAMLQPQDLAMDRYAPLFRSVVNYRSYGKDTWSLAVADVNGDGKPDLVVANSGSRTVSVLLGNGDGTFRLKPPTNPAGTALRSVAVGDVNGDGKPDLVVTNFYSSTVGVLLGNGDGTFQPVVTYGSGGTYAQSVAVADVNGDGKPDLVVSNYSGALGLLLANGDGTFQAATILDSGGRDATALAIADVNGDGKPDLLVTTNSYSLGVLLGYGDGTFQPAVTYGAGGQTPTSVAVADVNGDGKPDVVVANWSALDSSRGALNVLMGNGDGTFQAVVSYDPGGYLAHSIAVADVNGDGWPDLVVAECAVYMCNTGSGAGLVGVLPGNGDGTFRPAVTYPSGRVGAWSVAVSDVNGDGWPDLLVANANDCPTCLSGSIGVLLNKPKPWSTETALTTSGSPSFVGQQVTFGATITSVYTFYGKIPDGEPVMFYDGTAPLGSVALAGGTATYTTSSLSGYTHSIQAAYAGDATFLSSSRRVKQIVSKYRTTTNLTASLNPSKYSQAVTFTATVTPTGPYPLTGKVWFTDGAIGIGTVTLNGGVATLTKKWLAVGTHSITAQYLGDAASDKSTSSVLSQVVNP